MRGRKGKRKEEWGREGKKGREVRYGKGRK
jgi:hypothetical protein